MTMYTMQAFDITKPLYACYLLKFSGHTYNAGDIITCKDASERLLRILYEQRQITHNAPMVESQSSDEAAPIIESKPTSGSNYNGRKPKR